LRRIRPAAGISVNLAELKHSYNCPDFLVLNFIIRGQRAAHDAHGKQNNKSARTNRVVYSEVHLGDSTIAE